SSVFIGVRPRPCVAVWLHMIRARACQPVSPTAGGPGVSAHEPVAPTSQVWQMRPRVTHRPPGEAGQALGGHARPDYLPAIAPTDQVCGGRSSPTTRPGATGR